MFAVTPSPVSTLNGTWALDRVKSDFGAADAPRQFDVLLNQAGNRLDITVFIADSNGERVIQREALPPRLVDGSVWLISDNGGEDWRVTGMGELLITRTVAVHSRMVRQRLVLSMATDLQ